MISLSCYDVRAKSIVKALSLAKLHKQLKGPGERPLCKADFYR